MTRAVVAAALGALALAAPAEAVAFPPVPEGQALYPETVPGAGLGAVAGARHAVVRIVSGRGLAGGAPFSLSKRTVGYGGRFTAVGVHNALPGVDVFRIAWNHGASLGGRVTSGLLFIR